MKDFLLPAACGALLLYVGRGLLKNPRNEMARASCLAVALYGMGLTLMAPRLSEAFDSFIAIPNLSRLFYNGLIVVASYFAWHFLFRLYCIHRGGKAPRDWHGAYTLATLLAMAFSFSLIRFPAERIVLTASDYQNPYLLVYRSVYLSYVMVTAARISHRLILHARLKPDAPLMVGAWTIATGSGFGFLYAVNDSLLMASLALGLPGAALFMALHDVFISLAAGLNVLGLGLAAVGRSPLGRGVTAFFRSYVAYIRLRPLWAEICRVRPGISLLTPRPKLVDLADPRNMNLRLYRTVIEIRDGWLALIPYAQPSQGVLHGKQSTGYSDSEVDSEARACARALRDAMQRVESAGGPSETALEGEPGPGQVGPGGNLEEEVQLWLAVARHFRPLEAQSRKQAGEETAMLGTSRGQ